MRRVEPLLRSSFAQAEKKCREMDLENSEINNTRPWVRRGLIECGLRRIIVPPMTAEVVYGREAASPHPWNHTLITAGSVLMTQCPVQHYDDVVRPSIQREIYALPNKQKFLFGDQPPEKPNTNPLYSILTYGPEPGTNELGFAFMRFPKTGLQEWYSEKINVLSLDREFGHRDGDVAPEEQIRDPQDPDIREQGESA